jgi:hypothetical protein
VKYETKDPEMCSVCALPNKRQVQFQIKLLVDSLSSDVKIMKRFDGWEQHDGKVEKSFFKKVMCL